MVLRGGHGTVFTSSTSLVLSSPKVAATFKTIGFICALSIIHLKMLPPKMSLAFLEALIHGPSSVDDLKWLRKFHPDAARALGKWPTGGDLIPENEDTKALAESFDIDD
ncbi:hypothetical protein MPER_13291, partial [Moniliophthora perniciosa FA553]